MTELLIGCGSRRSKDVGIDGREGWSDLTTFDINPDHRPDIVGDLENIPLPFGDNSFDEIHAYDVLEHTGSQGDWRFFFDQWSDFWRILKPDGLFYAKVPAHDSVWAWGDPSHKRIIQFASLVFLDQQQYRQQVGSTPMSDFRFYYKADFEVLFTDTQQDTFTFVLRARKPSFED
jgi:SAM-dependent methyltransferase